MTEKKSVIQQHHISYNPEWVVPVYIKEHNVLDGRMGMNRWTNVSTGFLTALKVFIARREGNAVELEVENGKGDGLARPK